MMQPFLRNPRSSRRLAVNAAIVFGVYLALLVMTHPGRVSIVLGLDQERFSNAIFDLSIFSAIGLLLLIAYRLTSRQFSRAKALRRLHSAQAGTVMVEFAFVFPIILLVMGMIVQLALFANASLVVRYAAFSSARVAIISFTRSFTGIEASLDLEPEKIDQAAHLILATISPVTSGNNRQAGVISTIQARQNGQWGSRSYPQRMRYARLATTVETNDTYPPANVGFASVGNVFAPKQVAVTVRYKYFITIPGLYNLPGISTPAPAGVSGRVITIEQTVTLQSTGARESSPVSLLGGDLRL